MGGMTNVQGEFASWIGRTQHATGQVTEEVCSRLIAALDPVLVPAGTVPLGLHWCTALSVAPNHALGADGHPAAGSFLPPLPLSNRMWASSEIAFHDDLRLDDRVERVSKIAAIEFKDGRSGPLCFVTLEHSWTTRRGVAITEAQHIVYREVTSGAPASERVRTHFEAGADAVALLPDAALLFRYSAVTFNAHRIHYDQAYAVHEEGYPDLVVQGPLQATLLMNRAATRHGRLKGFSFRAVRPAFAHSPLYLEWGDIEREGKFRTVNDIGETCVEATAVW